MTIETVNASDQFKITIARKRLMEEILKPEGKYYFTCRGPRDSMRSLYLEMMAEIEKLKRFGMFDQAFRMLKDSERLIENKWIMPITNLVTDVGARDAQDKYFAGSAYTAAWYIFLMSGTSYTTGPSTGDTAASHSGWTEETNYSESVRPTTAWSAAATRSKTLSAPLAFSMNPGAPVTVKGGGLISNSTKGGTTGILYSVGASTEGDQTASAGDTINATYTSTFA